MIKRLYEKHGQVYVVIASLSKISSVNPLKSSEVKTLMTKGLAEMGLTSPKVVLWRMRRPKRYTCDPNVWVYREVARRLGRPFAFYTGNKSVIEALQGKPDIFPITMLSPRELAGPKIKNKQLSATEVRRLIRARLRWEHLLPRSVVDALKKRGLVQRIMDTMGLKKVHKHQR